MKKQTILFLSANPNGIDGGAPDREAHSIRTELKRSGYRDRFEFETRWAAEPLDLLRELRDLKPTVVHFSGRGGVDGLFFQAADGNARLIPTAALVEAFGAAGGSVKLAVLNAHYSEVQAEALLAHVDCVVGMGGSIHADAARAFAIGFYGGLGELESVAAAYRQGRAAISVEGLPDSERPQLKVRDEVDAEAVVPARVAPPAAVEAPCPYPGMRPYSADTAAHFHGRDVEIDELVGRLRAGEREIYVIGPSGSGKSSLVAAGLLPRLAHGVSGLGPFVVQSMRPGEHPTARLAEVLEASEGTLVGTANAIAALLAHRAPDASVLIVIDQLEELFTLTSGDEHDNFLLALGALRVEHRCVVVLALRADFFGAFMECPLWTDRGGQISRIEVTPLRGKALREAIARPARDLGIRVEPELIERLFADAASEPGILPLLQETMVQLWDRWRLRLLAAADDQTFGDGDQSGLTVADYEALSDGGRSGLAVALSRRADATLRALPPAQELIARRILLRLISFGEGRSDTRRQQPRSHLRAADDDAADFDAVLRRLIDDRLLTTADDDDRREPLVDLAHEALITAWPALAGWIQTRRAGEQRRRHLEASAAQWVERGRGAGGLLDPIVLADTEVWRRTETARELGECAEVAELVTASRTAHDKQKRRGRVLIWSAFATLTLLLIVVAMLAVTERRRADEAEARRKAQTEGAQAEAGRLESQHKHALSDQETGRQLLLDGHPQEAVPYLVAAREKGEEGPPLRMLFWAAISSFPIVLFELQGWATSAVFSPDGTRVVTTGRDNIARVWDAVTGKPLAMPLEHQRWVTSAAFSSDGTRVVTTSWGNIVRVWDVATSKPLTKPLQHQQEVLSAAFSPDGRRVVTASADNTARIWDAVTGKPLATPLQHLGVVRSAAFSPDGTRIVTTSDDHTARLWDAITGKPLATLLQHRGPVRRAAFSPDGTRIVTASDDHTARLWDAVTGMPLFAPFQHQREVPSAAFSPDGRRVVTTSLDYTARVWDAATGKPLATPLQHQGLVTSAVFSLDGTRVVTASSDHTARVWNVVSGKPLAPFLRHQREVLSAAFSPDGTRVVTASVDGARAWVAADAMRLQHQGPVRSATFSPEGTRVVTASSDHTARVWDVATGKPFATSLWHQGEVNSAAFSPNGTRVVTASSDHTARVWDAVTGKSLTTTFEHQGWVWSAAFSSDGTRVVTASDDHTARIWDATTGKSLITPLQHQGWVRSATFSPDDTRIVTISSGNITRIWDAGTGKLLDTPIQNLEWPRGTVSSPDGIRVVTVSDDNTAQIWDAITGEPLATALQHQGRIQSAAFSLDGTRVVTASDDKTAQIWDSVTGKPLTPPLEHQGFVRSATFSPDGTRVVTTSDDNAARIWEFPLDRRTLAQWHELAKQSPFVLIGGVLEPRPSKVQRQNLSKYLSRNPGPRPSDDTAPH